VPPEAFDPGVAVVPVLLPEAIGVVVTVTARAVASATAALSAAGEGFGWGGGLPGTGGRSGVALGFAAALAASAASAVELIVVSASGFAPFLAVAPDLLLAPALTPDLLPALVFASDLVPVGVSAPDAELAVVVVVVVVVVLLRVGAAEFPPSLLAVLSVGGGVGWSAGAGGALFAGVFVVSGGAFAVASSRAANGESLLFSVLVDVCHRCNDASECVALISDAILDVLGTAEPLKI